MNEDDEDTMSKKEWELSYERAMKYLGFKIEESRELPLREEPQDEELIGALLKTHKALMKKV